MDVRSFVGIIVCIFSVAATSIDEKENTVKRLNLEKFMGLWFEAYSSLIPKTTYRRNVFCSSTYYSLINRTTIKYLNSGNVGNETGPATRLMEFGTRKQKLPGAFIFNIPGLDITEPNFLVLKVGPATYGCDRLYQYAVIGAPSKSTCWIIVRDMKTFQTRYEGEALAFLKRRGYSTPSNKPLPTPQSENCVYSRFSGPNMSMRHW